MISAFFLIVGAAIAAWTIHTDRIRRATEQYYGQEACMERHPSGMVDVDNIVTGDGWKLFVAGHEWEDAS